MKAGMQDRRQVTLELFNTEEQERISLFDFAFRLNHSRLVTSRTQWPTDWKNVVRQGVDRIRGYLTSTADQWVTAFVLRYVNENLLPMTKRCTHLSIYFGCLLWKINSRHNLSPISLLRQINSEHK